MKMRGGVDDSTQCVHVNANILNICVIYYCMKEERE